MMLSMIAFHLTSSVSVTDSCISNILTHAIRMSAVTRYHNNLHFITTATAHTVLVFRSVLDLERPRTALIQSFGKQGIPAAELVYGFQFRG